MFRHFPATPIKLTLLYGTYSTNHNQRESERIELNREHISSSRRILSADIWCLCYRVRVGPAAAPCAALKQVAAISNSEAYSNAKSSPGKSCPGQIGGVAE
jgi:hypothetical protein